MNDNPRPIKSATEARQGQTPGVVRWVLGVSLALVIVGMLVAYFVAWEEVLSLSRLPASEWRPDGTLILFVKILAAETGFPQADAQKRVDDTIAGVVIPAEAKGPAAADAARKATATFAGVIRNGITNQDCGQPVAQDGRCFITD
jgi:hypothetical protein